MNTNMKREYFCYRWRLREGWVAHWTQRTPWLFHLFPSQNLLTDNPAEIQHPWQSFLCLAFLRKSFSPKNLKTTHLILIHHSSKPLPIFSSTLPRSSFSHCQQLIQGCLSISKSVTSIFFIFFIFFISRGILIHQGHISKFNANAYLLSKWVTNITFIASGDVKKGTFTR